VEEMEVAILVTKTCEHRELLEKSLTELGIPYLVKYAEDDPHLVAKQHVHCSPNIMVDGIIRYRGMPTPDELKDLQREYRHSKKGAMP
jgi:predicted thioredoxin/glutaredoxin